MEAQLLADVGAGKHRTSALTLALEGWIAWRESNGKPISPATLHNYRLTIDTKIKPGLGHLPVTKVDARALDRFYAALRKGLLPSRTVNDELRSEAALTMALLGLMAEEAVIAPRVGGKYRKRRSGS